MINWDDYKHFYYFGDYTFFNHNPGYIHLYLREVGIERNNVAIFIVSKDYTKLRVLLWHDNCFIQVKKHFKTHVFPRSIGKEIRILKVADARAIWEGVFFRNK